LWAGSREGELPAPFVSEEVVSVEMKSGTKTVSSKNERRISRVEMVSISKSFPNVKANSDVNISIRAGEILGLLGENGAGKTTLMNILYGLYRPDSGYIKINGERVDFSSPADAIRAGIGMVHQHFMLVQNHTVAENIALGLEGTPFLYPLRYVRERIKEYEGLYNLNVNPDAYIWQLSAGEQQRVEILKALFRGADLLILDEPTSVLTPKEAEELFVVLRRMVDDGRAVIFISHKLEEVLNICNRVTVLRNGYVTGNREVEGVTKEELARMMVGREILFNLKRKDVKKGKPVLEVKDIHVMGDRGFYAVKGISFRIYGGEVFGVAGVSGNGQQELVEALTGLRRVENGSVFSEGIDITNRSPHYISSLGIGHVPEERIKYGVAPNLTLYENAILKQHTDTRFGNSLFLNFEKVKNHARYLVERFEIKTPSVEVAVKNLSGGNIQKLILGREISCNLRLLIAAHPTYGLDVGATEYIRREILSLREKGVAVLLISEDLEELFEISDRLAVIFKGKFIGILERDEFDLESVGLMMTGSAKEQSDPN